MNCKFFLDKMRKVSKNVTVFLLRGKVGQSSKVSDEFLIQRLYNFLIIKIYTILTAIVNDFYTKATQFAYFRSFLTLVLRL